ncbi:MAG TPA: glycosyltransferase family 4 protein [Beijerinckiaceae bacterium]|jgi:glycosyltransferase involved in cell wall biosynthesis
MRILLANTGHPAAIKGGAEAAVLDLAHALAARGHSVALAVHHGGRTVEVSDGGGVRVYALPNRNLYFAFDGGKRPAPLRLAWHALDGANPFMAAAFRKILDEEKPDVVNTHVLAGLSQLLWREAARRGIPVVHYLHEYGTMCPRGSAFRDGRLCERPCAPCGLLTLPRKRLSGLVDTVVGVSRFTLERHLAWGFFPNAERAVVPNVFTGLSFTPRPAPPEGPLRLGYFGRLIPDKGAHLLLAAARALPPEGWTLDIAGTGDEAYVAALKQDAPANVRFLGWTRAEDFFPQIDALVVPSIWPDPQPRVVFEAYMHGVPVIGANAGGIPEQIDEDRTGWLFEAGSPESLAKVLRARLADHCDRTLGPEGFRARLAALDPGRIAALYEDAYTNAVERRRSRSQNFSSAVTLAEHTGNG